MKPGNLDRDAKEDLRKKYFLSEKQYDLIKAPVLDDTKLHMLEEVNFENLFKKLLDIHRYYNIPGSAYLVSHTRYMVLYK